MKKPRLSINPKNIDKSFIDTVESTVKKYFHTYVDEDKVISGSEKRHLIKAGKKDGAKGFPRAGEDNIITSSNIEGEIEALYECETDIWSLLQLQVEPRIQEMKDLYNKIPLLENELKIAEAKLQEIQGEKTNLNTRTRGDEKLTDGQVFSRRQAEYNRKIKPYKDKVDQTKQEIYDCKLTFEKLMTEIVETQNYTRMKCQKICNHTRQRIDIYYGAALLKHPLSNELPPILKIKLIPEGELTYLAQHTGFLDEAKEYILYLKHTYDFSYKQEIAGKSSNTISNSTHESKINNIYPTPLYKEETS